MLADLTHIVITRFSYRLAGQACAMLRGREDPLNPEELRKRFLIFEATALSSVLAQTNQHFTWVLVVDPDLPARYRERLRDLLGGRPDTHLVDYEADQDMGRLDWLTPFFPEAGCEHIVTTNVDDDDLFPSNFFAVIRENLLADLARGQLPDFRILATKKYVQWDMCISVNAPLGWKAPWHRGTPESGWEWGVWPTNVGFSVYCRYPCHNVSVFGVDHAVAEYAVNPQMKSIGFRTALMEAFREAFSPGSKEQDGERRPSSAWSIAENFFDVGEETEAVVIVNHEANDSGRLFESKPGRTPVTGPESFPGIDVDWVRLDVNAREFMVVEAPPGKGLRHWFKKRFKAAGTSE